MAQLTDTHRLLTGSELTPLPGARPLGPADPSEILTVRVCVRRRPDGPPPLGHAHWMATPPGKRNFLSKEEFAAKYGASQTDLDRVVRFASGHGLEVVEVSIPGRIVVLSGTAGKMSQVFAVELKRYEWEAGNYRGHEGPIHIPNEIADVVVALFGLDNRRVGSHNGSSDPPGTAPLSPLDVGRSANYNFPPTPPDATGQIIGVTAFGGGWTQSDIDNTLGFWGSSSTTPFDIPVTGNNSPGNPGRDSEVILDICVAAAVAPGATIQVYWGSQTASASDWLAVLQAVMDANTRPRPSALTNSWVLADADDQLAASVSTSQVNQISMKFQELGMMGVTVFTACGDDGSRSKTPDGKAHVQYPGSDPYVTSCGGTTLSLNPHTEWVWNDFAPNSQDPTKPWATGGGVSALFRAPLPDWQKGVNVPPSINDGSVGRGVPDVAGNASLNSGYQLTVDGRSSPSAGSGTSAVAPLYAGLMALINERLIQNVGFLNPTIYFFRNTVCHDINDVGIANSPQDNGVPAWTTPTGAQWRAAKGYPSGPGWDACTGLGVIDGAALLNVVQQPIPRQNNWRWCFKCQGLFYAGLWAPNLLPPPPIHLAAGVRSEPEVPLGPFPPNTCLGGVCPADNQPHDATQSGPYAVVRGVSVGQQGGWRWCHKCQGMFFAGLRGPEQGPDQGVCPAGGSHDGNQSVHYAAVLGGDDGGQQGGWRLCKKCQGMFFGLNANLGPCPAGGSHDPTGSANYAMLWGAVGNLPCGIIDRPDFT